VTRTRWDQAGITDERTGKLARPVEGNEWRRPPVLDIIDRQLHWALDPDGPNEIEKITRQGTMLSGFVALAVAPKPGAAVLAYAEKWGILGLCGRHGLPMTHPPLRGQPRDTRLCERLCERHGLPTTHPAVMADPAATRRCATEGRKGLEPVERWIFFAKHARATLNVAATLLIKGVTGPASEDLKVLRARLTPAQPSHFDWAQWWGSTPEPDDDGTTGKSFTDANRDRRLVDPVVARPNEAVAEAPFLLRLALVEWLDLAAIHPTIDLESGDPLVLAGDGLFGALALQLSLTATRTAGVAICGNCGEPYSLDRAPAPPPKRHYCPTCRAKGAWKKFAMRELRAKKRADAELAGGAAEAAPAGRPSPDGH
jgi:hypothetical protein